ncbi:hypothetical protein AB1Y20_011780 [Prymnesium parvum]|uniref:Phosphatidylinositol-3,4,5-trisphosphate 3-phosphatase n=1 Tax=Prymnesium parvum TaxID=97485 RepID=A0AB34IK30_PRYPA
MEGVQLQEMGGARSEELDPHGRDRYPSCVVEFSRKQGGDEGMAHDPRLAAKQQRKSLVDAVAVHGGHATGIVMAQREACRRFLATLRWQIFLLGAALIDISVLLVNLAEGDDANLVVGEVATVVVLVVFTVDIILRLYTFRFLFFRFLWNWFDLIVVVVSVALLLLEFILEATTQTTSAAVLFARASRTGKAVVLSLRWARAVRALRLLTKVGSGSAQALRHQTGENKKRFVDLAHSIDLDLTYITPQLIAMSVPATGRMALYRNPLPQVSRFLETRYPRQYMVVNCCPEHPYPTERFATGVFELFDIQDHTPPSMEQYVHFLNEAAAFASERPSGVIVVHCRGGKGRTGSMVCAWLLFTGVCVDAEDALHLFALERTELTLGRKKLQGVDTPSQRRSVCAISAWLHARGYHLSLPSETAQSRSTSHSLDAADRSEDHENQAEAEDEDPASTDLASVSVLPRSVEMPPEPPIELTELRLEHWYNLTPTHHLICAVHAPLFSGGPMKVVHWSPPCLPKSGEDVQLSFPLSVTVMGDVRVSVFDFNKLMAARAARVRKGESTQLDFDATRDGNRVE